MKKHHFKYLKDIVIALISSAATLAVSKNGLQNWIIVVLVTASMLVIIAIGASLVDFLHSYSEMQRKIGSLTKAEEIYKSQTEKYEKKIAELDIYRQKYYESNSRLSLIENSNQISAQIKIKNSEPDTNIITSIDDAEATANHH